MKVLSLFNFGTVFSLVQFFVYPHLSLSYVDQSDPQWKSVALHSNLGQVIKIQAIQDVDFAISRTEFGQKINLKTTAESFFRKFCLSDKKNSSLYKYSATLNQGHCYRKNHERLWLQIFNLNSKGYLEQTLITPVSDLPQSKLSVAQQNKALSLFVNDYAKSLINRGQK